MTERRSLTKRTISLLLTAVLLISYLFSCTETKDTPDVELPSENGITIGISSDFDIAFNGIDGEIKLGEETYREGELKPFWKRLSDLLGVKPQIDDENPDIIITELERITELAQRGKLIDLSEYRAMLPSLSSYLRDNPELRCALSSSSEGEIFAAVPYISYEPSTVILIHEPTVRMLLDGEPRLQGKMTKSAYTPYITVPDGTELAVLKDGEPSSVRPSSLYAGNIIEILNSSGSLGDGDAYSALGRLRDYIDTAYSGVYTNRSEFFIGESAAYNTDELIALLAVASRLEDSPYKGISVGSEAELISLVSVLFGVRGLDTDGDTLFFDADGSLADARFSPDIKDALRRTEILTKEGLISFDDSRGLLRIVDRSSSLSAIPEDYTAIPLPVSRFSDETGESYVRFDEGAGECCYGIALSLTAATDRDRLCAALSLIDYLYTEEGRALIGSASPLTDYADFASDVERLSRGDGFAFARDILGLPIGLCPSLDLRLLCASEKRREELGSLSLMMEKGLTRHSTLNLRLSDHYTDILDTLTLEEVEWTRAAYECGDLFYGGAISPDAFRKRVWQILSSGGKSDDTLELLFGEIDSDETVIYLGYMTRALTRRKTYFFRIFGK